MRYIPEQSDECGGWPRWAHVMQYAMWGGLAGLITSHHITSPLPYTAISMAAVTLFCGADVW